MIIIPIISLIISIFLITILFINFRNRQEKFDKDIKLLYRIIQEELNVRLTTCESAERDHEARLKKVETFEDYKEELNVRLTTCESAERDHEARLKKVESFEDYKELFRPYIQTWQPPCYSDDGICTNPQHDCINCPRLYGNTGNSGKYKQYWTSNSTSTSVNNFDSSNVTVTDENVNKEFITPTNKNKND